jgi:hypothetical protein
MDKNEVLEATEIATTAPAWRLDMHGWRCAFVPKMDETIRA